MDTSITGIDALLQTADPELRRKLTPNFPIGCKRQLVSNEWFDTLVRPNVEVVDTPIERVTETGLRLKDGTERKVDAIIYGTSRIAWTRIQESMKSCLPIASKRTARLVLMTKLGQNRGMTCF